MAPLMQYLYRERNNKRHTNTRHTNTGTMRAYKNNPTIVAQLAQAREDASMRHESSRDTIMRLFASMCVSFSGYRSEIDTRRKYCMVHDKAEYRKYIQALRANREYGTKTGCNGYSCQNVNDAYYGWLTPYKTTL